MKTSDSRYSKCIYFVSNALARKIEKLASESWKPTGLSPSHAYLLMMVLDEPGVQPSAIVHQLQLTPSTITRLVEKLEGRKLVVRTTEGKETNIYPTAKAKELLPKLKECMSRFCSTYNEHLGKEESARLVQNMARVADKLAS